LNCAERTENAMIARLISISCAIALAVVLAGCGGGGSDGDTSSAPPPNTNTPPPSSGIGAAGGTVTGPSGAQVVVPAGALTTSTNIAVAQSSAGAPPLPAGITAFGQIFAFTPHGTTFAVPATITVPFDPTKVPAGTTPVLYKTDATQSAWEVVSGATVNGQLMSGSVTGFSFVTVASPASGANASLTRKQWSIWAFDANTFDLGTTQPLGEDTQTGGVLNEVFAVGDPLVVRPAPQPFPEATMQVFSNESGATFWASAQAPLVRSAGPAANTGLSQIAQTFTFRRKPGAPASLRFVLTKGVLETIDSGGAGPGLGSCPWLDRVVTITQDLTDECANQLMQAFVSFRLTAAVLSPDRDPDKTRIFVDRASLAFLQGAGTRWSFHVDSDPDFVERPPGHLDSNDTLWTERDFVFNPDVDDDGRHARVTLAAPFVIEIPITGNVAENEVFTVAVDIINAAVDRVQGESFVGAYLRDPLDSQGLDGGVGVEFDGLEQLAVEDFTAPAEQPVPCTTGADPNAGTLQFAAPDFRTPERWPGGIVTVERVGGTQGDVSALVEMSDGTALAGSDYASVRKVVQFADGQDGRRTVAIPVTLDDVAEDDETANLKLTLFKGCATLGTQATATLTVLDDDRPSPVAPIFKLSGTVTGLTGSGLLLRTDHFDQVQVAANGAFSFPALLADGATYTVTVATQPNNPAQICTVTNGSGAIKGADVTNIAVACVTPQANGQLDATFGSQGKVFVNTLVPATALASQADGKLLALGGMTLSRYNADGSVDSGFGSGGKVTIVANGGGLDTMTALAVQPDGKIVVVGFSSLPTAFNDDFVVMRFNTDGTPDTSFGSGGKTFTDFDGINDQAKAVLLQSDGKIVVAGQAQLGTLASTDQDFAVVRYFPDGTLDASYGTAGKVTLNVGGRSDFVNAAALQADGSIIVVGRVFTDNGSGNADIGVARFRGNGSVDGGFGNGGIHRIDFGVGGIVPPNFDGGEWDEATDVAIQGDGKIVLGGYTISVGVFRAALVRLTDAGNPDGSFGASGLVSSSATDKANRIALQSDGQIVIAGTANSDFAIARFAPTGAPDTTFGTSGLLAIDFFGAADTALDVLVQPDGKIIAAGSARNGTSGGLGLARVLP
jgi:uncharacterized delta-60 repeat protein